MDEYQPVEFQVFVLRLWVEPGSGVWRGQVVHLPDQQAVSFAHWTQALAFMQRFVAGAFQADAEAGDPNLDRD